MNLLFINSARTWGGTEKWTRMAAESAGPDHHAFLVYRRSVVGERFNVTKFRLPCMSHIDLYTIFQVARIVRKHHIDVIIPTKRKDYLVAGIASKLTGTSCLLRLGIRRTPSRFLFHRLMYGMLPDGIIVNANEIRDSLMKASYMREMPIAVIFNGLDTATIERRFPEPLHSKPSGFGIVSMGILTARKGFDFLIRAFESFIRVSGSVDAHLTIIGEGPEHARLAAMTEKLGIPERVTLTGFIDDPLPVLAGQHVVAMASANEGIPNALLEGICLGNAPVSTRAGGAAELIDNGSDGLLVDYGDVAALSDALLKLYVDPAFRLHLAFRARQRVIEQFSIERMSRELLEFCEKTIRKKRRNPLWHRITGVR